MDANGLRFWLLADADHWRLDGEPPGLEYDSERRALRLARQRRELRLVEDASEAAARLERVPAIRDLYGNHAWYDADWRRVLVRRADGEPRPLYRVPVAGEVSDLAVGADGVLYLAVGGDILLHDLRGRWDDALVTTEGFTAWRIAAAPDGGLWVLDRTRRRLARLRGLPLSRRADRPRGAGQVRPCRENPNPPRLYPLADAAWPDDETPVALACSLSGRLACLAWREDEDGPAEAVLRCLDGQGRLGEPQRLLGSRHPYSLAWQNADQVALLVCGEVVEAGASEASSEARVYPVRTGGSQYPAGDLYPLKPDYDLGPFLHGLDYPPHYPAGATSHGLHRLSFPFFTRAGEARDRGVARPLDAGEPGSVWHRLYLEAVVPVGCGLRIWLAASERADAAEDELAWFEHRLGDFLPGEGDDLPRASWLPQASELPHHPGLLPCAREPGRKGLFTVLVQRHGRRVRSLRGRYLHLRLRLHGPGNATPELYALRAYANRFSYVEHYLPELYHEQVFAPEADENGGATPADFLERYVDNMEGVLTTLEDRIAFSDLLTRPRTVPAESLDWLGSWVGLACEPGWGEAQRRAFLEHAGELHRWHGTLHGLRLALDLVSDGGVGRGEIVVVEDFRLRRTFATILGADLDDGDDPLTLGAMESGNSFVGDSLFLGDEDRREFLALFAADLELETNESEAVAAFFDSLAFRVTLLVREGLDTQTLGNLQRIAEREVPAHVKYRIQAASPRLLVGIASLVGVDTWLDQRPAPRPARVDRSHIGRGDLVTGRAALDLRMAGVPDSPPPEARAHAEEAAWGEDVVLDASDSRAAEGRRLVAYRWSLEDGDGIDFSND